LPSTTSSLSLSNALTRNIFGLGTPSRPVDDRSEADDWM